MRRILLLLLSGLLAAPAFATISLTTPVSMPNVQRWKVSNVQIDDENSAMRLDVEVLTSFATNLVVTRARIEIFNVSSGGLSTRIGFVTPISGSDATNILSYSTISLATGYTDALTAWRSGSTSGQRKSALEAYLISSGIVDSTFAGS